MINERLYFRELVDTDAERLFEIYSNAEAMKYRETKPMTIFEDAIQMLQRTKEAKANNYEYRFAIIEKESEQLIGTVMFQPLGKKAIIGYSIDQNFWNKGYGSLVVKMIVTYLKSKEFYILEALVKKENVASCKVLEKNGFQFISQTIYPRSHMFQLNLLST